MRTPKYSFHRASGQARVRINGKDVYLGPWDSPESKRRHRELVAEWRAEQNAKRTGLRPDITIQQLADLYFPEHVDLHYRKNGQPTSEVICIKSAINELLKSHGDTNAADFGPMALDDVRKLMAARGLLRNTINGYVGRIRRMFKWAASRELIRVEVYLALETLAGLQKGRCAARESDPVTPVPLEHVESVKPLVSPAVTALIDVQLACGCRPGEAVSMRMENINMKPTIWEYNPDSHKTEHHGRQRTILLGPKAQNIIRPFLRAIPDAYLFSPTGRDCKYRVDSYRRAIRRACEIARVPVWSPNQLRHTAATEIRRQYGLEAAQVILGHSRANTTEIYAEKNCALAREVMAQIG